MKFRTATTEDAASIAALSIEVWTGTYLREGINGFFADFVLSEFTVAKTHALLCDPDQIIIVSQNAVGIDGVIRLSLNSTPPLVACPQTEIATLYVQPRHHGKGIGRGLLGAAFEHLHARGLNAVWLTTNSENTPAIRFYNAFGFCNIGTTEFRIHDQAYKNEMFTYTLP